MFELILLIFVSRQFSHAAKAASRPRLRCAAIGGVTYLGTLVLFKIAEFPLSIVLAPVLPAEKPGLPILLDVASSNLVSLATANLVAQRLFNTRLSTTRRLAHVMNLTSLVVTSLVFLGSLPEIIVDAILRRPANRSPADSGAALSMLALAALVIVYLATLCVYKSESLRSIRSTWLIRVTLWANALVGASLIWFAVNLKLGHPVAFSLAAAYFTAWCAIAAGLNAVSLGGLEILPSRTVHAIHDVPPDRTKCDTCGETYPSHYYLQAAGPRGYLCNECAKKL